jgi:hypothetical protein
VGFPANVSFLQFGRYRLRFQVEFREDDGFRSSRSAVAIVVEPSDLSGHELLSGFARS